MLLPLRFLGAVIACASIGVTAHAQNDVQVETGTAVESPDGGRRISVDRLLPISDGEPERYSGRMVVRVTDPSSTGTAQQYFVEASQVRVLNPPVWLDNTWGAISYNIAKNASGLLYVDTVGRKALQVELVGLQREMAQAARAQYELTSYEVTRHEETTSTHIRNVVYLGRSVFPLVVPEVPSQPDQQITLGAVESLRASLDAYLKFEKEKGLGFAEPEQASETLSPDEKYMAFLACSGGRAALLIVPVTAPTAEATLGATLVHWLDPGITLGACIDAEAPENASSADETPATERWRYTTAWQNARTVVVERETFDDEAEPAAREALLQVTLDGKVTVPPRPAKTPVPAVPAEPTPSPTPAPQPQATPRRPVAAASAGQTQENATTSTARPRLQVTTRSDNAEPSVASKADAPAVPPVPEPSPSQLRDSTPTPAAETTPKPGLFRRLNPFGGRSAPAPEFSAPPDIIPTPSD